MGVVGGYLCVNEPVLDAAGLSVLHVVKHVFGRTRKNVDMLILWPIENMRTRLPGGGNAGSNGGGFTYQEAAP